MMATKSMQIALDTSLLTGLLVPNDLWHTSALALWEEIKAAGATPVYFDCVAAETISVAVRRLREKHRLDDIEPVLEQIRTSIPHKAITWILPDVPDLFEETLTLVYSSKGELNFNDALIAISCRLRAIPAIASFDQDFDSLPWLRRICLPEHVREVSSAAGYD